MSAESETKKKQFADLVMNFVKEHHGIEEIEYIPEEFKLKIGDWTWYLHNAFDEYYFEDDLDKKLSVLMRHSNLNAKGNEDIPFEEVKSLLLPAVRDRLLAVQTDLEFAECKNVQELEQLEEAFLYNVVAEHYAALIAIDTDQQITYVDRIRLGQWNSNFESLLKIATDNLKAMSEESFVEVADGVYASSWHDSYDTSRILLIDKIKEECGIQGEYLAFMPNRDHLFITGSEDIAGIKMVLDYCAEIAAWPRPMCMIPLILQNDRWIVFAPPEEHKCYRDIRFVTCLALNEIYQTTQIRLQSILGDEIFVASFSVYQTAKTESLHTLCTWSTESLLPKTEWISFVEVDDKADDAVVLGTVQWDEVAKLLGSDFVTTLSYPPRTWVKDFIDKKHLESLNLLDGLPDEPSQENQFKLGTDYLNVIEDARYRFMETYRKFLDEHKGDPKSRPEIAFEYEGANELQFGTARLDFVLADEDESQIIEIAVPNISIEPTEYQTADGIHLLLKPIAWNAVDFICDQFDSDSEDFQKWCAKWMDLDEVLEPDDYDLSGVLHSVIIPKPYAEEQIIFTVDFGSAPIAAFEELLKTLYEIGVSNVTVRSLWNTG